MNKVVLKVELLHDDKIKKNAMKAVSSLSGVETVSLDMKDKKLTLIGDIDPVLVVSKLRKLCHTEIVTVGPAKEEKKEPQKEKKKKVAAAEEKKKDENENMVDVVNIYDAYHTHQMRQPHYYYTSLEENSNACVIC